MTKDELQRIINDMETILNQVTATSWYINSHSSGMFLTSSQADRLRSDLGRLRAIGETLHQTIARTATRFKAEIELDRAQLRAERARIQNQTNQSPPPYNLSELRGRLVEIQNQLSVLTAEYRSAPS